MRAVGRAGVAPRGRFLCGTLVLLSCLLAARSAPAAQLAALPLRGLKAEVATLIIGAGDGGPLAMAVLAIPELSLPAGDGERRSVPVLLELEGASLMEKVEQGGDRGLTVELYLYALDEAGTVEGFFGRGVRVALDEFGEALYDNGLKLLAEVELSPGHYILRFLARESSSGRYGLRSLPIDVPGEEATGPYLSSPLVGEARGGWLVARPANQTGEEGEERSFPRLEREGEERLPTGLAILPLGATVLVDLVGAGLSPEGQVQAALVAHGDGGRTDVKAELRDRSPLDSAGREHLLVELHIPADAPVATYRLEMTVGGSETRLESGLETVTVPASEVELVWGQVRHYLAGDVLGQRAEVSLPRGRRRDRRGIDPQVREAYRAVLERLVATSETEGAVAELVKREGEIFRDDPADALERLRETEVTVAKLLGAETREGLLPLVVLHLEAYRRHRARRDYALATHARLTAADITELYVKEGESAEVPAIGAVALTCLASDLTVSRLWKQSDLLLERATELDSTNSTALLLLAANRERFGDYGGAVGLLRKAIDIDPRADVARLRLAVNLIRIGHLTEGEQHLRRLLRVRTEEWVQALAYEELGRLLLSRSRPEEAARELRAGVSRYPIQQGLYVLLAYLLEQLGEPQEGAELLSRMPVATGDEPSPRYRYAQPRSEALAAARAALLRYADVRLPELAEALTAAGEE